MGKEDSNNNTEKLDIKTLENWLWEAACAIRGPIDAPKYKDFILPLIFLKRLSDVYDDEFEELVKYYGDRSKVEKILDKNPSLVRIKIPDKARWSEIKKQTTDVGGFLTDAVKAIAKENPELEGVIDITDFNQTAGGQRVLDDDNLKSLIQILDKHRLGKQNADPDIIGQAYEYLLRKFAEGSGQSAGEFYTPREVAQLMANLMDPSEGNEIYDPCLGSGGLLIKCFLLFHKKYDDDPNIKPLKFFGQEILHNTYAMARMNMFIHNINAEIHLGNTMTNPATKNPDGTLRQFDIVLANPMWNQNNIDTSIYEKDGLGRFGFGTPPKSSADWGWVQHMYASLKDTGKMAVVLDTGAVSRGSGNLGSNRERDIRKAFVDNDLVESVILLPENLFYNTTAPGIILIINKAKPKEKQNNVLLINASKLFAKGRPKNFLPDESIEKIYNIYQKWQESEGISKIVSYEEIVKNDYNLSPSRYVLQNGEDDTLDLEDVVVQLQEAEEERKDADEKLKSILREMGLW